MTRTHTNRQSRPIANPKAPAEPLAELHLVAEETPHRTKGLRAKAIRQLVPTVSDPSARFLAEILTTDRAGVDRSVASLTSSHDAASRSSDSRSQALIGQFPLGHVLPTSLARYRIRRLERRGEHCDTYWAEVLERAKGSSLPFSGDLVVIKIPRIADDMTDAAAANRLEILNALFDAEVATLKRLHGIPGVARFLDRGEYTHRLQSASKASVFVVQDYVDGEGLRQYWSSRSDGRFCGVPDAQKFFQWARMLATALHEIHRRLVIHGLICPDNLRVNRQGQPVLVDFGEDLFAQVMDSPGRLLDAASRYMAPERTRSVGADLFSLGGVLFYLATGEDPPTPYEDIEILKQQIETTVRANNPALLKPPHCGAADIIARCLRYSHRGRVESAAKLLRDIDTFDAPAVSENVSEEVQQLLKRCRALDHSNQSLLSWMAVLQIRELTSVIDDMTRGSYDLAGDPDAIRRATAGLLSILDKGDEFLAIALPKFWWPENIGINGRFWSKTKEAIERGVKVRRVFLLDKTLSDRHLDQIVAAHRSVEQYSANYSVRYLLVSNEERDQVVREGKHFGLFAKNGHMTAFFPQYRADGMLETVRFRTDPTIVTGLRDVFRCFFEDERAAPLADLKLSAMKVG